MSFVATPVRSVVMVDKSPSQPPELSVEQGQRLIQTHLAGYERSQVTKATEIRNLGFRWQNQFSQLYFVCSDSPPSYSTDIRIYILDIAAPDVRGPRSCFVTVSSSSPTDPSDSAYHSNALPAMHKVISLILSHTSIPILSSSKLDVSLALVPFHYILSPAAPISSDTILPLSAARKAGMVSPQDAVRVDLMLGKFLGELHSRCQNEWFGLVRGEDDGGDDSTESTKYSWQETFSLLFETVLSDIEALEGQDSAGIPFYNIRLYYTRAIGSFLFDDVQVPSLVWFTGSEEDIYISLAHVKNSDRPRLAAILPNVSHALWGDPLLETFFMEEKSEPFMEAYKESGGEELIYLARHKTKRLWYTLFLALIVLRERGTTGLRVLHNLGLSASGFDAGWAKRTIVECTEALKDAPCY